MVNTFSSLFSFFVQSDLSDCHKSDEIYYLLNAFRLELKKMLCISFLHFGLTRKTLFYLKARNYKNHLSNIIWKDIPEKYSKEKVILYHN